MLIFFLSHFHILSCEKGFMRNDFRITTDASLSRENNEQTCSNKNSARDNTSVKSWMNAVRRNITREGLLHAWHCTAIQRNVTQRNNTFYVSFIRNLHFRYDISRGVITVLQ